MGQRAPALGAQRCLRYGQSIKNTDIAKIEKTG